MMSGPRHPAPGVPGGSRSSSIARVVRTTLEVDSCVVGELFAPDAQAFLPTSVHSPVAIAVEIEDRLGAFTDVDLRIVHTRDLGSEVWAEWTASVRHTGPFAIDGQVIEPSGCTVELSGVAVAAFAPDGRISAFREYWDSSALARAPDPPRRARRRQRG